MYKSSYEVRIIQAGWGVESQGQFRVEYKRIMDLGNAESDLCEVLDLSPMTETDFNSIVCINFTH